MAVFSANEIRTLSWVFFHGDYLTLGVNFMRSNFHEFQFAKRNIAVERQNKLEMASNAVCAAVAHFAADYISSVLNSDSLGIHTLNWVFRYLTNFRRNR